MTYYSPLKAIHHIERLKAIKENKLVIPSNLQIDLESYCPYSCKFCSYRNVGWQELGMQFDIPMARSKTTGLSYKLLVDIPKQMQDLGIKAVEITGGGESLAHPNIVYFIKELDKYDRQIALVTNGIYFNEEMGKIFKNAVWVRFSMDAVSPEVYSKIKGVSTEAFNKVVGNIKKFIETKNKDCIVGISFIITPDNIDEIEEAGMFYKELGCDNIRYSFVYEPSGTGWLSKEERIIAENLLSEVKKIENEKFKVFGAIYRVDYYSRPNTDFNKCYNQRFVWAIGYNGLVYPCCIMKYHKGFEIGDLYKETLKEIAERQVKNWNFFDVRNCKPCWLRDKNQFIEYLLTDNPPHINYI